MFFFYASLSGLSIQDFSITVGFLGPWDPWHYAMKPLLWGQRRQSRRCRQGDPTNLKLRGSLDALPGKRHEVLRPIWRNSTKSSPSGCRTRQHFLPRACETCWGQRSATAMITSVRLYATDHVSPEGGERKNTDQISVIKGTSCQPVPWKLPIRLHHISRNRSTQ